MKRLRLLAAFALPSTVTLAHAAAPDHLSLEEIVVTDTAIHAQTATSVGAKTIEKGKNVNIPDVLRDEAEIDIKRRAGVGDTADILAIRGLSANRIMLNINDRPVNAAGVVGGYYIDWGTIPLDNVEKIEVIKGGSSVRHGNNALGGVINVVTKKPTETPTVTLFGNYGLGSDSDAIQNYRLTHSWKVGPLGYSLAGSFQQADAYLWNNDFEGKNLAASFLVDMPFQGELSFGLQYAETIRGFIRDNRASTNPDNANFLVKKNNDFPLSFGETFSPYSGSAFDPGPGSEWDKEKYYLDSGYKQPMGDALLELTLYQNHEDRKELNYSSSFIRGTYPDGRLVLDREVQSDRSRGGNLQLTKPLGTHELMAGVDYKILAYGDIILNYYDRAYNGRDYTGTAGTQEGTATGYYLQDTWKISDRFTLTPGLRYDRYANKSINTGTTPELEDNALSPKLTGTYKITNEDKATLSLYQAMRTPGLPETWWWYNGPLTLGKSMLQPEKNEAVELTFQHDMSTRDFIRLSAYHYSIDDYIIFRTANNLRGVYNVDQVTLYGAAAEGRLTLNDRLACRAALTYQHSEKEGDSFDFDKLLTGIDYLPAWKASLGMEIRLPFLQSVLNATLRTVGDRQTLYLYPVGNQQRSRAMTLDPYTTADIDLKIPVTKHVGMNFYVENLFNTDYEEQFGYPMQGTIVGSALKIHY